jgi:alkanesulfonate monooxygenase SsuD/methylene tetrahydromethanopterin reductase-like flavin-dependent oxidoreductase (luciferase family)
MVDRERGIFADPEQITLVKHEGKYFRSQTAPPVFPSPQGRPVLFQAGSSGRGQRFAVKHADAIFAIQPNAAAMKKLRLSLEEAAEGQPVRLTCGIHVVLGGTEEEAQRKYRALVDRIPIDAALTRLSGSLGVDFSKFELDKPLKEMYTDASQGLMKSAMVAVAGGEATLREASLRWAVAAGCPPVVGTAEQVADKMEQLWRESGCYGFNITPSVTPEYVTDFVDQVVPILQQRGIFRREYTGKTFRDNLLET